MSVRSDPVAQTIIDFLDDSGPKQLKGRYVEGDVVEPAINDLPLGAIFPISEQIVTFNNHVDASILIYQIHVLVNWRADLKRPTRQSLGTTLLKEIISNRQSNYAPAPDSLLGALRSRVSLAPNLRLSVEGTPYPEVNYGGGLGKRGSNANITEAFVTFGLHLIHNPK